MPPICFGAGPISSPPREELRQVTRESGRPLPNTIQKSRFQLCSEANPKLRQVCSAMKVFSQSLVAGLRWRLFDFGRVDAEVKQARGANAEALIQYRSSVLRATEDVENAFSALAQSELQT